MTPAVRAPAYPDQFPQDVVELLDFESDEPRQAVHAVPGKGDKVPVWILGSSLSGARLAAMLDDVLSCSAVGSLTTVRQALHAFVERTGADELMITSQIFDHEARMQSYDITAQAVQPA